MCNVCLNVKELIHREREDLEEEMAGFMTGIIVEAQTIGEQKERRFGRE